LTVAGAPVDGTTPVASVSNLNQLAVRVDLSEFDIARASLPNDAEVYLEIGAIQRRQGGAHARAHRATGRVH
jgi:hypothetical protein